MPNSAGFISSVLLGDFTWRSLGMNETQLGPSRKGQAGPCDITHTAMRFFSDWMAHTIALSVWRGSHHITCTFMCFRLCNLLSKSIVTTSRAAEVTFGLVRYVYAGFILNRSGVTNQSETNSHIVNIN